MGYGAFPLGMIEYLWRAKQPYNVSVAAETAACAALSNPGYLETVRNALVEERGRLFDVIQAVPYLEPYPSAANFVLCKVRGEGPIWRCWSPDSRGNPVPYYPLIQCPPQTWAMHEQSNGRRVLDNLKGGVSYNTVKATLK